MSVYEAIIKIERAGDPDRAAHDIEDGIGYACALLMDEYGRSAEQIQHLLERVIDTAWDNPTRSDSNWGKRP